MDLQKMKKTWGKSDIDSPSSTGSKSANDSFEITKENARAKKTLCIMNVDVEVANRKEALFKRLLKFGDFVFLSIKKQKHPRCSVYVAYSREEDAQTALKELRYVDMRRFQLIPLLEKDMERLKPEGKIFVRNLHQDLTNADLHELFSNISPELYVSISTDDEGEGLGHGLVHFFNESDAQTAFERYQGCPWKDKPLVLEKWKHQLQKKTVSKQSKGIYLKNLKNSVCVEDLDSLFERFGKIASRSLRPANKYTKFAVIAFEQEGSCAQAVKAAKYLTIQDLFISKEDVYIDFFKDKSSKSKGSFINETQKEPEKKWFKM